MSCLFSPVFPLKSCAMLMALQAQDDESTWFEFFQTKRCNQDTTLAFFTVLERTKIIGSSPAEDRKGL